MASNQWALLKKKISGLYVGIKNTLGKEWGVTEFMIRLHQSRSSIFEWKREKEGSETISDATVVLKHDMIKDGEWNKEIWKYSKRMNELAKRKIKERRNPLLYQSFKLRWETLMRKVSLTRIKLIKRRKYKTEFYSWVPSTSVCYSHCSHTHYPFHFYFCEWLLYLLAILDHPFPLPPFIPWNKLHQLYLNFSNGSIYFSPFHCPVS